MNSTADCPAAEVTEGGELTCLERLSLLQSRSYLQENKRGQFRARAVMDAPAAAGSVHRAAAKNVNEYNKTSFSSAFLTKGHFSAEHHEEAVQIWSGPLITAPNAVLVPCQPLCVKQYEWSRCYRRNTVQRDILLAALDG